MNEKTDKIAHAVIAWIAIAIVAAVIYWVKHLPESEASAHADDPQWLSVHAEDEARYACHDRIKSILKAPSTAEFPSVLDETVVNHGNGDYTVGTYVDAQNSFGATLRSRFTCEAVTSNGTSFLTLAKEQP
jgi:hypothetical protein